MNNQATNNRATNNRSPHTPPTRNSRRLPRLFAVLAAVGALVAVGASCGDDDATTTTTAASADNAAATDMDAYCEATLAASTAGEPDIDFENATPEEMNAAIQEFAEQTVLPLVDDALALAPEEIRDDGETLREVVASVAETGDPSAFEDPEFIAASERVDAYDVEACGWNSVEVTAHDYEFVDLPDELEAGVTSFTLTNDGEDAHEMVLIKRNEGADQPIEELLEMPEDEVMDYITMMGTADPVPAGRSSSLVADLTPGGYIAICFIPVGAKTLDGPPPDGPPHFTSGMVSEFTVS